MCVCMCVWCRAGKPAAGLHLDVVKNGSVLQVYPCTCIIYYTACVCACVCLHICVCVCMHMCVRACVHVQCMYIHVCVSLCVHMYMCVCVVVCITACTPLYMYFNTTPHRNS